MNVATQVVVPAAALLLLFALGLTLDLSHLGRLVQRPRPLLLGLLARWLVVPATAVALCRLAHPAPATALGILLLACCPLATPVPALVRAAGGDTALGVALTAVTNLSSAVTLPVLLSATTTLAGVRGRVESAALLSVALRVGALVVVPTVLGMLLRRSRPELARWAEPRVTPVALVLLVPIVGLVLVSARESLVPSLLESGGLAVALNVLSLGGTAVVLRLARLTAAEAVPILLGSVLFNFGVDAFVSLTLLRDPRVLLPGIACGLMMWLSGAAVVALARRARPQEAPAVVRLPAAE